MCAAGDQRTFFVGQRVDYEGYHGTVKFVGEVKDQTGVWVGVEWDDASRGKHNGSYNGEQYFSTSHPTSGSFIHPSKIKTGCTCFEAIQDRYGKVEGSTGGVETNLLLETKQAFKAPIFEVVGFDQINKQQSDFKNLKVVNLTNKLVSSAGDEGQLLSKCPQICELSLSHTLISNWKTLADIAKQLHHLRHLDISDNRLSVPAEEDVSTLTGSFKQITKMFMGNIRYSWKDILSCANLWPNVEVLGVQNNNIVTTEALKYGMFSNLKLLFLDQNLLLNWEQVNNLGKMQKLELLGLGETGLKTIFFPGEKNTSLFPSLKTLWFSGNPLNDWGSINELNKLTNLENLLLNLNPIMKQEKSVENIIARIRRLKMLNGCEISPSGRKGSEYDYLKLYGKAWLEAQANPVLQREFHTSHPRYSELIETHGAFGEDELSTTPGPLKSRMMNIIIFRASDLNAPQFKKKVPRDMGIQKLSGLVQKLLDTGGKIPSLTAISAKAPDAKVALENVLQDLSYYSVEDGDSIAAHW